MEGVCCECQSVHPIRMKRRTADEHDLDADNDLGPAGGYVMDIHDAWGSHCDGSGAMPQTVLKDNKV